MNTRARMSRENRSDWLLSHMRRVQQFTPFIANMRSRQNKTHIKCSDSSPQCVLYLTILPESAWSSNAAWLYYILYTFARWEWIFFPRVHQYMRKYKKFTEMLWTKMLNCCELIHLGAVSDISRQFMSLHRSSWHLSSKSYKWTEYYLRNSIVFDPIRIRQSLQHTNVCLPTHKKLCEQV